MENIISFIVEIIDLFLLEGTEVSFDGDDELIRQTEQSLQRDFANILKQTEKLVVVNPYERNIDRLLALQNTAHENGRKLL
ncbi:hypothetical protein GCM10025879_01000 [Leuconostoc litchii]|nr:hypothetical protein [Leuconostoc litchii]GMA68854.1 hypothetical protein GCM10025879_01000 [Leuconostoc litchii]